jgi:hypothetical protein
VQRNASDKELKRTIPNKKSQKIYNKGQVEPKEKL